jgi:hypothetical protein
MSRMASEQACSSHHVCRETTPVGGSRRIAVTAPRPILLRAETA